MEVLIWKSWYGSLDMEVDKLIRTRKGLETKLPNQSDGLTYERSRAYSDE